MTSNNSSIPTGKTTGTTYRNFTQAKRILVGAAIGLVIGALLQHFPEQKTWLIDAILQPLGDIFLKLVKMIVVPLVFSCMVVGIAGSGESGGLGRVGVKALLYFFSITTVAIILGLIIGNVLQPGAGVAIQQLGHVNTSAIPAPHAGQKGLGGLILSLIPENIISAMAQGQLLPVLFFAVLFGIGLSRVEAEKKAALLGALRGVSDTMFQITRLIMNYSPVGICALMAIMIANMGLTALLPLIKLIVITYIAVILFALLVLGAVARFIGVNIFHLIVLIKDELIIAFSDASSASVLPQLIQKIESYGVPRSITTLVIPAGYSFNLDGASLFLGIGTLFIAQLYHINLSWADQAVLVVTMVLTSKGAAGVPGYMFVILASTLSAAGLPLEGIAIIASVYRLMDMPNTALNVLGNALAPLVIAKWEKQFTPPAKQSFEQTPVQT